jgi:hypothetical protein
LKAFGGTDAYLGRAVKEYLGEDEEELSEEDDDSDNY